MNINLIETPITRSQFYYVDGVRQASIDMSLDPNGSPIYFTFDSETIGTATYAQAFISITYNVLQGDTFTVFGQTFIANNNPTADQFFSCDFTDINERTLCLNSMAQCINDNANLNWRFSAVAIPTGTFIGVLIRAKYTGTSYSLNIGPAIGYNPGFTISSDFSNDTPNSNIIVVNFGTDANRGQQLQDYRYGAFLEIWEPTTKVKWGRKTTLKPMSTLIATLELDWTADNRFTFDISRYLRENTNVDIPLIPTFSSIQLNKTFTYIDSAITSYWIKWGETFTGSYDINTGGPSLSKRALLNNNYKRKYYIGESDIRWSSEGVFRLNINPSLWQHHWQNQDGQIFPFSIPRFAPVRILTYQPLTKLRRRMHDEEYIYFYENNQEYNDEYRQFRLRTDYTFIDGTTVTNYTNLTTTKESGLFLLNVSLQSINFDTIETNNTNRVLKYTHQVEKSYNVGANWSNATRPFNYIMDLNCEKLYYKIYWKNDYGVYDQFEFEGVRTENAQISRQKYSSSLSTLSGNQRDKGTTKIYQNDITYKITYNTGWIDKDHLSWLQRSMLTSTEWLTKEINFALNPFSNNTQVGTDWVSLILDKYKYEINSDETLFNMEVTFYAAIDENSLKQ